MKKLTWIPLVVLVLLVTVAGCGSRPAQDAPAVVAPTIAPTVSLLPIATATPDPDLAYKQIAVNHLRNLAEGMQALGVALQNPRIGESDWALQVTVATTQMQDAHTFLSASQPPAELAVLHTQLTDATRACSAAADAVYTAIDTLDNDMLIASGELLGVCNTALSVAITALGEN